MKVEVKKSIKIESGFRAGSAIRISADGGATWDRVAAVPDATYVGDKIYRESVTLSSGQWAAESWFNQGRSGTVCVASDEATAVAFQAWLDAPAPHPVGGIYYFLDRQGIPATIKPTEVRTNADWLRHFELGADLIEFRATEWTEIRYSWGCQDAACWWRIGPDGEIEQVSGVGNNTPTKPDANGNFTTPQEEWEKREWLMDAAECGDREALHRLNGHLPPPVVDHLAAGYAAGLNPLKGLRKKRYTCEYNRSHGGNTTIWDGARWHHLTITK